MIGAAKSGTTTLWHHLRAHPDVFVPEMKEPTFFVEEENWSRGLDWYRSLFRGAGGAAAVGEVSPGYTRHPFFAGVPGRIAAVVPDVRLVYLVRHPIERMRSQVLAHQAAGTEPKSVEAALAHEPRYLQDSRYHHQLEQYLEFFAEDRILVCTTEDLASDPETTVARILGFVGADPQRMPALSARRHNTASDQRLESPTVRRFRQSAAFARAQRVVPLTLRRRLWQAVTRPARLDTGGELSPELERRLAAELRDDVRALRRWLGPDFDGWGLLDD